MFTVVYVPWYGCFSIVNTICGTVMTLAEINRSYGWMDGYSRWMDDRVTKQVDPT